MEVRYEALASDPIKIVNEVYGFINHSSVPERVSNWYKKSLQRADAPESSFSTIRKNSVKTAFGWRGRLNPFLMDKIEKVCSELIKYLYLDGYFVIYNL